MKMYAKRFISVLLALTVVLAACPLAYAAQEKLACGHSDYEITIEAKEPTCEQYGYTEQRECNKCSYVQKALYREATGHHYEMDKSQLSASGEMYICNNCGDSYIKNHADWTVHLGAKSPTCTQNGYTAARQCNDCGYYEESEYLPATNHNFDIVKTDEAKHTLKCSKCSYTVTDEKHNIVFVYDGKTDCYSSESTGKYVCSICKTVKENDVVLNTQEHHQNVTVESNEYYNLETCQDCNFVKVIAKDITCACSNIIKAEDYILKQPNCENDGYLAYSCGSCGVQKTLLIGKFGHQLSGKIVITRQATCQNTAIRSRACLRCDYVELTETPKVDHLYISLKDGVEATCTEDGITDLAYCIYCGETILQAVIPAKGHTLINYNDEQFCTTCYKYLIDTEAGTVACKCLCHNHDGLSNTIYKLILFFAKIFGIMQSCDCGAVHY